MPLVSVIIPCYGQARFLPQAVRSVLDQSLPEVEIVIVDDGSPDHPLDALGTLIKDPRILFIRQDNAGVAAARNRGIHESRGELLSFLDADDWLHSEFCRRLTRVFEQGADWGFAYCDMQRVPEHGATCTPEELTYSVGKSRRLTTGDVLPSLLLGGYFSPNTVMVPRRILELVGEFDRELGGHADWDLWLRISASGFPACYVDERLAYYRLHAGSMSTKLEHMRRTKLLALTKLLRRFPDVTAAALDQLIAVAGDLYSANQALQREFVRLDQRVQEIERLRQEESRRNAEIFDQNQRWISTLQEGKDWNEQQAYNWRHEAERLAGLLRNVGASPAANEGETTA